MALQMTPEQLEEFGRKTALKAPATKTWVDSALKSVGSELKNSELKLRADVLGFKKELETRTIQNGNTRISSDDIIQEFKNVFLFAETEICIMSPWISDRIYHKYLKDSIANALNRGVKIKILYGFLENSTDRKDSYNSDYVVELMKKDFPSAYGKNLIIRQMTDLNKYGTHGKLVIKDDDFYLLGSFNFLSYGGKLGREELTEKSRDKKLIAEYKNMYFSKL